MTGSRATTRFLESENTWLTRIERIALSSRRLLRSTFLMTEFVNVEMLYRASDALVTDYSSAFIDYMFTCKPAVSFAYDYESYMLERGGFYDLDFAFPGPICKSFDALQEALDGFGQAGRMNCMSSGGGSSLTIWMIRVRPGWWRRCGT